MNPNSFITIGMCHDDRRPIARARSQPAMCRRAARRYFRSPSSQFTTMVMGGDGWHRNGGILLGRDQKALAIGETYRWTESGGAIRERQKVRDLAELQGITACVHGVTAISMSLNRGRVPSRHDATSASCRHSWTRAISGSVSWLTCIGIAEME